MPAKADPARRTAAAAIVRLHEGGWANLIAKEALAAPLLSARDRAFAGALFYGAAERLVTLDTLLAPYLKRPPEALDAEVRAVLETGVYQMFYMRVPVSAAVNESVKLVRSMGKSSAAGLVNAVLRRVAEAGPLEGRQLRFASELERVQVVYSVGEAVARAVMQALPEEYDAFLAACFGGDIGAEELCLRANTLKITVAALARRLEEQGARVRPGTLPGCLYTAMPGGVAADGLFAEGLYHVQGEASQYACACLGARPGMRVLDLCAAPGGKSATLAQQMGGGVGLTCCDVQPHRLPLIEKTFARLGIEGAAVLLNDAAEYNEALAGQQAVLCDVPCSGLGVLRKKPDLRYVDGQNFTSLPALQLKVLNTAARYVVEGGRLVYSTCTIRKEENGDVVSQFLRQNPAFRAVAPPMPPPQGAINNEQNITILPHCTGLDGFFVATLQRL